MERDAEAVRAKQAEERRRAALRAELAEAEALGLVRIARVTVYAKCGNPVRNASDDWLVRALPNVDLNPDPRYFAARHCTRMLKVVQAKLAVAATRRKAMFSRA